jgi:hypothetical protein
MVDRLCVFTSGGSGEAEDDLGAYRRGFVTGGACLGEEARHLAWCVALEPEPKFGIGESEFTARRVA